VDWELFDFQIENSPPPTTPSLSPRLYPHPPTASMHLGPPRPVTGGRGPPPRTFTSSGSPGPYCAPPPSLLLLGFGFIPFTKFMDYPALLAVSIERCPRIFFFPPFRSEEPFYGPSPHRPEHISRWVSGAFRSRCVSGFPLTSENLIRGPFFLLLRSNVILFLVPHASPGKFVTPPVLGFGLLSTLSLLLDSSGLCSRV